MADNMEAQEIKGWNVFKQIFNDHWGGFKKAYTRYSEPYYEEQVKKMMNCGNQEEMGYIGYLCFGCGQGSRGINKLQEYVVFEMREGVCGVKCMDDFFSQVSRKEIRKRLTGWWIIVIRVIREDL